MVTYKKGNLLTSGCNIICHQCNAQGVMGKGIAWSIRNSFPQHYLDYRAAFEEMGDQFFGSTIFTSIKSNFVIAAFVSQFDYWREGDPQGTDYTDYAAFRNCCQNVKQFIQDYPELESCRIGFPDHIGCGLAGGDWDHVRGIIEGEFAGPQWNVEVWKL